MFGHFITLRMEMLNSGFRRDDARSFLQLYVDVRNEEKRELRMI